MLYASGLRAVEMVEYSAKNRRSKSDFKGALLHRQETIGVVVGEKEFRAGLAEARKSDMRRPRQETDTGSLVRAHCVCSRKHLAHQYEAQTERWGSTGGQWHPSTTVKSAPRGLLRPSCYLWPPSHLDRRPACAVFWTPFG